MDRFLVAFVACSVVCGGRSPGGRKSPSTGGAGVKSPWRMEEGKPAETRPPEKADDKPRFHSRRARLTTMLRTGKSLS